MDDESFSDAVNVMTKLLEDNGFTVELLLDESRR